MRTPATRPTLLPSPAAGPPRPAATRAGPWWWPSSVITACPVPGSVVEIAVDVHTLAVAEQAAHVVASDRHAPPVRLHAPGEGELDHPAPTGTSAQRDRQSLGIGPDLGGTLEQLGHDAAATTGASQTYRRSGRSPGSSASLGRRTAASPNRARSRPAARATASRAESPGRSRSVCLPPAGSSWATSTRTAVTGPGGCSRPSSPNTTVQASGTLPAGAGATSATTIGTLSSTSYSKLTLAAASPRSTSRAPRVSVQWRAAWSSTSRSPTGPAGTSRSRHSCAA